MIFSTPQVSLVPERVGHQRLLSLVTSAIHVPLVAQSALTTLKVSCHPILNISGWWHSVAVIRTIPFL